MMPNQEREPLWRAAAILTVVTVILQVMVTPLLDLAVAFGVAFTPDQRGALEGVARAIVGVLTTLGVAGVAHGAVTPVKKPTLPQGTEVSVQGTEDKVIIESTPPGPVGVDSDGHVETRP